MRGHQWLPYYSAINAQANHRRNVVTDARSARVHGKASDKGRASVWGGRMRVFENELVGKIIEPLNPLKSPIYTGRGFCFRPGYDHNTGIVLIKLLAAFPRRARSRRHFSPPTPPAQCRQRHILCKDSIKTRAHTPASLSRTNEPFYAESRSDKTNGRRDARNIVASRLRATQREGRREIRKSVSPPSEFGRSPGRATLYCSTGSFFENTSKHIVNGRKAIKVQLRLQTFVHEIVVWKDWNRYGEINWNIRVTGMPGKGLKMIKLKKQSY